MVAKNLLKEQPPMTSVPGRMNVGGVDVALSSVPMPVVYFDRAPSIDHTHGVIGVTLVTTVYLPNSNDGIVPAVGVAAYLKCSVQTATELRAAIDNALLLAQPAINPGLRA